MDLCTEYSTYISALWLEQLLHSPLAEAFWAPKGGNYGKLICASMCHDSCKKPIAEKEPQMIRQGNWI